MPLSPRLLRPRADSRADFPHNPNNLVLVYDTSLEPENNTISVPLTGTVNCTIDWGDGTSETHTTTGFKTKTYANPGVYIVQISGTMTVLNYTNSSNTSNNKPKLVRCLSFGSVGLVSLDRAFQNCVNFIQCPRSLPTTSDVVSLLFAFNGCSEFNDARVTQWNTSSVTNMNSTFGACTAFNQDISGWNTSSVTGMNGMFRDCTAFNQDISGWNTANVTGMQNMFNACTAFNQDISGWNTARVNNMASMFAGTGHAFAQDIGGWDIRKVTTMAAMFSGDNWGTANYDAALEAWADLADTDLTIGTTANTSQAITAFAQQGANTRVTSNGHGLAAGSRVNISGTTNYNGDYNVLAATASTFDIAQAFVANDATGTMRHRRSRNVTAGFGTNKYSAGAPTTKRGVLTGDYSWSITDGGQV